MGGHGVGESELYEHSGDASRAEREYFAREAAWLADPDWLAFRREYQGRALAGSTPAGSTPAGSAPEGSTPEGLPEPPEAAQKGAAQTLERCREHLLAAARRGHALAQHRLATELHVGCGRLGLEEDPAQAAIWYARAARNGYPQAVMHLLMLNAAYPEASAARQAE